MDVEVTKTTFAGMDAGDVFSITATHEVCLCIVQSGNTAAVRLTDGLPVKVSYGTPVIRLRGKFVVS